LTNKLVYQAGNQPSDDGVVFRNLFTRSSEYTPSSISTGVSLATFAWRRHCGHQYWVLWGDQYSVLFRLFARRRHCYAALATR